MEARTSVRYASAGVTAKLIIAAVDAIAVDYRPLSIRLFGSYAYGSPSEDSWKIGTQKIGTVTYFPASRNR